MTLAATAEARPSSPSARSRRAPVFVLALVGAALATYLTLYQWHVTTAVWDPLFGSASSEAVLTSSLSRLLPLPDATLGALAYLVEAILAVLGGEDRYRTQTWLVLLYGLVLAGLALTSLVLVLTQIFLVHALCTLCLCSAAISFINAWLGRDEVFAAIGQFHWRTHAQQQNA
ncbi:MAG: vitamin K epoxide reductase [Chloroflexi bacterium]|nr:vitamin K epoxide reductase [Chloroflexota bacterium]MBV9597357.1 vitamin K epoxide reductase [Chloroflexota bacterium]